VLARRLIDLDASGSPAPSIRQRRSRDDGYLVSCDALRRRAVKSASRLRECVCDCRQYVADLIASNVRVVLVPSSRGPRRRHF
jgi:hypothetical protein